MAREPKPVAKEDGEAPTLLAATEKVTYTPGPGDSMETTWMGHKFKAHVPNSLDIPSQDAMDIFGKPADQRSSDEVARLAGLSKRLTTNARLVTMARGNKFFHVGEFDPAKHGYKEIVAEPKTAEAYRAWCIHWLRDVESVDDLCERWANEAKMRARLEVGYDDLKYIASLLQPKLDDLIRREDEPRQKRDELIRNHELADLELQIAGVGQSAA